LKAFVAGQLALGVTRWGAHVSGWNDEGQVMHLTFGLKNRPLSTRNKGRLRGEPN
jgi:hypothetical protein